MNSAFVGYEELSRSRRVFSTEAEGRGETSKVSAIFVFTCKSTQSRPQVFSVTVP